LISLSGSSQDNIRHFIYFGFDRENISDSLFLHCPKASGAQLMYWWKFLEPEKDRYDFSIIENDLAYLLAHGKQLFIQLNDVTFNEKRNALPRYLLNDTTYHGGGFVQYEYEEGNPRPRKGGWTARRWDPAVRERFQKLIQALGKAFDGRIAGINLDETAVGIGRGSLFPAGYTAEGYRNGILDNMNALKKAFQKSDCIQYANFMPGGYIPGGDESLLRSVYEFAWNNHIGIGGPDILVYKPGQMRNSYGLIRESAGRTTTGVAVQDGNYDHINPKTGKKVTVEEIYVFAKDYLELHYIFWCNEEPHYSNELIPFLQKLK
jgi:hypothetical protein